MPISSSVLLFGNDAELLKTRGWLLESVGCTVYTTTRVLALSQVLTDHPIDLLILCHSLSSEECDRAKSIVQSHVPKLQVLILRAVTSASSSAGRDRVVNTGEGPKSLLDAVESMVTHPFPPESSPEESKTAGGWKALA